MKSETMKRTTPGVWIIAGDDEGRPIVTDSAGRVIARMAAGGDLNEQLRAIHDAQLIVHAVNVFRGL